MEIISLNTPVPISAGSTYDLLSRAYCFYKCHAKLDSYPGYKLISVPAFARWNDFFVDHSKKSHAQRILSIHSLFNTSQSYIARKLRETFAKFYQIVSCSLHIAYESIHLKFDKMRGNLRMA